LYSILFDSDKRCQRPAFNTFHGGATMRRKRSSEQRHHGSPAPGMHPARLFAVEQIDKALIEFRNHLARTAGIVPGRMRPRQMPTGCQVVLISCVSRMW